VFGLARNSLIELSIAIFLDLWRRKIDADEVAQYQVAIFVDLIG
jgi:hypothetical protein